MKLNRALVYEKLGKTIYLSMDNEVYLLDNEVSFYIFDLLKKDRSRTEIKEKTKETFASEEEFTNDEKDRFVDEFLSELHRHSIIL
ncbi:MULTISPECIES: PqqD family protein [unclassified Enterococcus]|uniref:PqqD family protein n=1 Tax=unclassified Enterococcus TaxID=2608891 RepID=UPI0013EC1CAF|nr:MULTISPECIES: PqqD family protein [unclassified Enterococcus]